MLIGAALLASVCACGEGFEPCPSAEETSLVSGTFSYTKRSSPGFERDADPCTENAFPHLCADSKQLTHDREAKTVTVTYERDGATIKETWRVTRYYVSRPFGA